MGMFFSLQQDCNSLFFMRGYILNEVVGFEVKGQVLVEELVREEAREGTSREV